MKGKIAYVLLILATLWAAAGEKVDFSLFLLPLELFTGAALLVQAQYMKKKIALAPAFDRDTVIRGNRTKFRLILKNRTFFPAAEVRFTVKFSDAFGTDFFQDKIISKMSGVESRAVHEWETEFTAEHCGMFRAEIVKAVVYDYFGIWSTTVEGPFSAALLSVIPGGKQPADVYDGENSVSQGEKDRHMSGRGTDSREIFDTRIYQNGDMLKNIHWKLSAKEDQLIIREFSMSVEERFLVAADPCMKNWEQAGMEDLDKYLEDLAHVCRKISCHGILCDLVWYSVLTGGLRRRNVESREDLNGTLEEILGIRPCEPNDLIKKYVKAKRKQYQKIIVVAMEENLSVIEERKDGVR